MMLQVIGKKIHVANEDSVQTKGHGCADFIDGNLEVKLPTKWTDEAAEAGTVREENESEKGDTVETRSSCAKR